MLKRIYDQVVGAISSPDQGEDKAGGRADGIRRATGVLMLDVALADKTFEKDELEHLLELAEQHFGLEREEASDFIERARSEAEDIVSLHEFTQVLHNTLDEDEKAQIVGMLWKIAYADGQLDKYENSLILKISDLLYVSRGRVMRLKHDARIAFNG